MIIMQSSMTDYGGGLLSWLLSNRPGPSMMLPGPDSNPDLADLTKQIKAMARHVGTDHVGITKINRFQQIR